eukprot:Pgem_evm1s7509
MTSPTGKKNSSSARPNSIDNNVSSRVEKKNPSKNSTDTNAKSNEEEKFFKARPSSTDTNASVKRRRKILQEFRPNHTE